MFLRLFVKGKAKFAKGEFGQYIFGQNAYLGDF